MSQFEGNFGDFGMDTTSLAGPLEAKLRAICDAGFTQVMLAARDLVGHADGWRAAVASVKASGLRVTGFQVLLDFEGLAGHLHDYKGRHRQVDARDVPRARLPAAAGMLVDVGPCDG